VRTGPRAAPVYTYIKKKDWFIVCGLEIGEV